MKLEKLLDKPRHIDVIILSLFVVLATFQPFFLHGQINIFENGLYLPGIAAILNGEIPFRDFFHLRGPLELYMPAMLMKIFGMHIKYLAICFYVGTILCMLCAVFIAKEILKTRFLFYLFVPVFVARTFPRVVFTYWGGMRYAFGLLAVWLMIQFLKNEKRPWIFATGWVTAFALLTSIEVGVCVFSGVIATLMAMCVFKKYSFRPVLISAGVYLFAMMVILLPFIFYMHSQHALSAYVDSVYTVITRMQIVVNQHLVSVCPHNLMEALIAMVSPSHDNFRQMTPSYLYIFILAYLVYRLKKRIFSTIDLMIVCVGAYGLVMYNASFRLIWASQFEMALQPEKILLFYLAEYVLLWIFFESKIRFKTIAVYVAMISLLGSSLGYCIARYHHRFIAFTILGRVLTHKSLASLSPYNREGSRPLKIARSSGVIVLNDQADDLEQLEKFVNDKTQKNDIIMTFPELGAYNFFFDRRFLGRFPMTTFAWFKEEWYQAWLTQFKSGKAKYVFLQKQIPQDWKDIYLPLQSNRRKYEEIMRLIKTDYTLIDETPLTYIFELKK